jgi:hypothetical protein
MKHEDAHNVPWSSNGHFICVIKFKVVEETLGIQVSKLYCETFLDAQQEMARLKDTNQNATFKIIELVNPISKQTSTWYAASCVHVSRHMSRLSHELHALRGQFLSSLWTRRHCKQH